MKSFWIGTTLFVFSLLVTVPLAAEDPAAPATNEKAETSAEETDSPGQSVMTLGNEHISSLKAPHVPYNTKPPTSGPHTHNVAKWGVYRQQVPDELQVHNLEDGGVVVQYNCDDCKDMIKKLEKIGWEYLKKAKKEKKEKGQSKYGHILVGPYRDMDTKIALTAWGKIDRLDAFDEARIRRFIEAYVGIDHHPKSKN